MPDTNTAPDGTATSTTTPGGTPGQAPAEAAQGSEPTTLEGWRERALKDAAIKKDVIAQRDALKAQVRDPRAAFLESEEGRRIAGLAAEAEALKAARAEAVRLEAEAQGKFKELLESERVQTAKEKADHQAAIKAKDDALAAVVRTHTTERLRDALAATMAQFGPLDSEWLTEKIGKAIDSGAVKLGADGRSIEGVGDAAKKLVETYPRLFGAPSDRIAGAFEKLREAGVRVEDQAAVFAARDAKQAAPRSVSLAEYAREDRLNRERQATTKQRSPDGDKPLR